MTGAVPSSKEHRRDFTRETRTQVPVAPQTGTPLGVKEEGWGAEFDSHAVRYEEVVDQSVSFTGRDSAFFAARRVEILESIVRPHPLEGLSVLDVGCGTGTTDRLLRPRVGSLFGLDMSEEMLAKARTNAPDADFGWYDGDGLPFPDEVFDVVMTICVLHHVPISSRVKFISEMVRVARPAGVVAIFEHNPLNPLTRHAVNRCELDRDAVLLSSRETMTLLRYTAESEPSLRHFLFSPLGGPVGRALDRSLQRVPLGGQYVASVRRPHQTGVCAACRRRTDFADAHRLPKDLVHEGSV